jgi:hypothetical protein
MCGNKQVLSFNGTGKKAYIECFVVHSRPESACLYGPEDLEMSNWSRAGTVSWAMAS